MKLRNVGLGRTQFKFTQLLCCGTYVSTIMVPIRVVLDWKKFTSMWRGGVRRPRHEHAWIGLQSRYQRSLVSVWVWGDEMTRATVVSSSSWNPSRRRTNMLNVRKKSRERIAAKEDVWRTFQNNKSGRVRLEEQRERGWLQSKVQYFYLFNLDEVYDALQPLLLSSRLAAA